MSDHDLDHVVDELPALLGGELNRRTTSLVTAHLRDCDDCRHALVDLAAASAALHSAVRFAPEMGTGGAVGAAGSLPDPAGLLSVITGQTPSEPPALPTDTDLPPLEVSTWDPLGADSPQPSASPSVAPPADSTVGRPVPAGEHRPDGRSGRQQRRLRPRLILSAAAAVIVLAVGTAVVVSSRGGEPAGRELALRPVESTVGSGTATLRGDILRIQADGLPKLDGGRFYQVWLVQGDDRLFAVGLLPPDGRATYQLTKPILDDYSRVEISVEPNDGDPGYSGHSVLRASYS